MTQQITLHRILPMAKRWVAQVAGEGDTVIDATVGNGNETAFLAELVGARGKVYGFDIQQQALDATRQKIGACKNVVLIKDSHACIADYVTEPVQAAMFTLGYLPYGDDMTIVTQAKSTILAIEAVLARLVVGGIITVAVYSGHAGGEEEKQALLTYMATLPQANIHCMCYELINQKSNSPLLLGMEKMRNF